jgi:hypothetical protein
MHGLMGIKFVCVCVCFLVCTFGTIFGSTEVLS